MGGCLKMPNDVEYTVTPIFKLLKDSHSSKQPDLLYVATAGRFYVH